MLAENSRWPSNCLNKLWWLKNNADQYENVGCKYIKLPYRCKLSQIELAYRQLKIAFISF